MRATIYKQLLGVILLGAACVAFAAPADVEVKKSRTHICHERGTAGYEQTVHFKAFDSVQACLKSGGRLPKHLGGKRSTFDPTRPAHPGAEGVLFGPLVKIIDGDTLKVKIQGAELTVRLVGIDAPESDQPFGDVARDELARLIGQEECVLVYDEGDKYGRLVAHLWIGETYVNAELVKRGMAWFDSASAPDDLQVRAEEEAREGKRGLWALPLEERVPPWEWRREQR